MLAICARAGAALSSLIVWFGTSSNASPRNQQPSIVEREC
jgi:hypothetical protein